MNSKEFIKAVDAIVKEKNIDREYVFEAMELALATAYKKNFDSLTNSKIFIDRKTGDIKVYSYLTVVDDDAEDPDLDTEITLSEARKINKTLNVGDTIDTEVTPKDFGRVAAATAKQEGRPYTQLAAEAKLFAAETAMEITTKAIQLLGGYGYTRDLPVERMFRDAKITEIYEGTSEVQRMVISGAMLK